MGAVAPTYYLAGAPMVAANEEVRDSGTRLAPRRKRGVATRTAVLVAVAIVVAVAPARAADPLPSWKDGEAKRAILAFVAETTSNGGPGYVPPAERIATFDNDGTLWAEQPMYFQLAFVMDRVKALAPAHPEWKDKQPFKAAIEGDFRTLAAGGEHALLELIMATHAGMTTEEFE